MERTSRAVPAAVDTGPASLTLPRRSSSRSSRSAAPAPIASGAESSRATGSRYAPAAAVRSSAMCSARSAVSGTAPLRGSGSALARRATGASGRSTAASRTGSVSWLARIVPSGARNPTTGPPGMCSRWGRRPGKPGASGCAAGGPARSRAARSAVCMRAPEEVSAQSAQGSPVICPSWRGADTHALGGASAPSGWNAFSGWIQNRSPSPTAGRTRAPETSARASPSPASARTGAPADRTVSTASPWASARSPALPWTTPLTTAPSREED